MPKQSKSLQDVEALLQLALKYGALEIETQGIKVKLGQIQTQVNPEALQELDAPSMPSDTDMLFWSAGGALPSEALKAEAEASGD